MKNKKNILIIFTVASLAIAGFLVYKSSSKQGGSNIQNPESSQNEGINYSPPTKEETEEADNIKARNENQSSQQQPLPQSNGKKIVTPIITASGQTASTVEVSARVPGINEDGGTCTLTLTKSGQSVSGTRKGVSNVSEVSCGFIIIPRNKVSAGAWKAKVSYSSKIAEGVSAEKQITVQ